MGSGIDREHSLEKWGCEVDEEAMKKGEPTKAVCFHRYQRPENPEDFIETGTLHVIVNPTTGDRIQTIKKIAQTPEELEKLQQMAKNAFTIKPKQSSGL